MGRRAHVDQHQHSIVSLARGHALRASRNVSRALQTDVGVWERGVIAKRAAPATGYSQVQNCDALSISLLCFFMRLHLVDCLPDPAQALNGADWSSGTLARRLLIHLTALSFVQYVSKRPRWVVLRGHRQRSRLPC